MDANEYCSDALAYNPDGDGYVHNSWYFDDFGGTSGSTPIVAGTAVLLYEMYQDDYFGNNPDGSFPYSSTAKAMLIADAYQYPLTAADRDMQGWGVPDIQNTYDFIF